MVEPKNMARLNNLGMLGWAVVLLLSQGCMAPSMFAPVELTRSGRPIHGKVAVVYSRDYQIKAGGIDRFRQLDVRKYERIYRALIDKNIFTQRQVFAPGELSRRQLSLVHTDAYLKSLEDPLAVAQYLEAPSVGVMSSKALETRVLRPFRLAGGGTLLAARQALKVGIGINIGGGYHHAKPANGEGFCIYADVPVAIRQLQKERKIRRALVIDLDVHQGNGTIVCLRDDPDTYTFSMHERGNYPYAKERGDEDVELATGIGDAAYLAQLSERLEGLFDRAGRPDIVFYSAGSDTLEGDPLGRLRMTHKGIANRDQMVVKTFRNRGIPVVMTLGGGYSDDAWKAHYISIRNLVSRLRSE